MDREIDVQHISQQTLDRTNIIFAHNGYGFIDLTNGEKEILYRDANSLYEWFRQDRQTVDDGQLLNDNAAMHNRAGGQHGK